MEKFIKAIPKVELHCHIDGSLRIESMYEILGLEDRISLEEFKKEVRVEKECASLKDYLEKFEIPIEVMNSQENIERLSYEIMEDLSKEGVMYAELRFAPNLHKSKDFNIDEIIEAVIVGMERAEKDFSIKGNLILICMRHHSLEDNLRLVRQGEKFLKRKLVAIDLAGNETDFPPELHKEVFDLARNLGYKITVHAGETGSYENIDYSIRELGANRIGHGIAAIKNKSTMNLIKEKNVVLETCPISNMQTKAVENMEDYPLMDFYNRSLKVCVNTDNRTVSNTSLEKEYRFIVDRYGFTKEDLANMIKISIYGSFASDKDKLYMYTRLEEFLDGKI